MDNFKEYYWGGVARAGWGLVLALALLVGRAAPLRAQAGSWTPPGANPAYPRTLLTGAALRGVRASLAAPSRLALYQSLWTDVQSAPPTDNSSSSGRRARATFAKNAAFVVVLGRQPTTAGGPDTLAPVAHDTLVARTRRLLEGLNANVEAATSYTEWQWRSKELIDYLVAYDLLRGAGETPASLAASQAQLQAFAGNLYGQSTKSFYGMTFFGTIKNNHALMTAAALGMAAVVLSDATSATASQQPRAWANAGLFAIDNVLWRDATQRQSDSTQVAGYGEGPYYLKYALLNCLPFFRAMGNFLPDAQLPYTFGGTTRNLRNPYFDPKYDLLYGWLTAIMQPDGRLPALADSYVDMGMPELALTGKAQYVKPMYFSNLTGTSMASALAQLRDVTVDMRAAWLAAALDPTPPQPPALTVLPASGNLVLRSGSDSLASYLHLAGRAKAGGGGHSHGDASSFLLHAKGQLLALDAGYLSYDRRSEVGQAANHNLVLVDGAGPAIGAAGSTSATVATIANTFQTPQLLYGEVATAYQQATITRRVLLVRNTYFLLADAVSAAAAHTYTWQLHGYGLAGGTAATGVFTDSLQAQEATWQKNGVGLLAHVAATGGAATYTTATNEHETTYNTSENHTTLLVKPASDAPQAQFLAALYPYTTQRPQVATTSQPTTAGLATTSPTFTDVAFAQADSVLTTDASGRLPQALSADGQLTFYSAAADGTFAQLFMQAGTVLNVGPAPVVQATRRATLAWQRTSATRYDGYVSRATTLTLALASAPSSVSGPGVASFSYDASAQQLQVVLGQASAFGVVLPAGATPSPASPLPVVLTSFAGQRVGPGVVLSWRTASELNSQGFEIQRRTATSSEFDTISLVASQGDTQQGADYTFRDAKAPASLAYYRLRQLDLNGRTTYSPVVAVGAARAAVALLPVAPQPAHGLLVVQLAGPRQPVTLRLLDDQGRVVLQQLGQQQAQLDVSSLAPGLYYLVAADAAGQPVAGGQKVVLE